jgi:2,4-dienoyl-CoA reductase-like NADH-dependent reductase (Old Yellow Enzyme family)
MIRDQTPRHLSTLRRRAVNSAHPALTPVRLAGLDLRTRVAVAPMTRVSATAEGLVTEDMTAYYQAYAQGGFGLVITEGTYTDTAFSQGYAGQPGITDTAQALSWRPVTEAVHEAGARIVLQLMHAGALAQGNRFRDRTAGPSAIRPRGRQLSNYGGSGPWPSPVELTRREITEVVKGFAASAVRARDAGFDGVEIHAANGYLLDQFLDPRTNLRQDGYGGGAEQRVRLTREVLAARTAATGAGFTVGVRFSQAKVNDPDHRWPDDPREAETVFTAAADAGADYLHIAGHQRDWSWSTDPTPDRPRGRTLPAIAGAVTGLPVVANGGLHDTALAARVLDEGQAQLLAIGTGALADPDLPHKLRSGEPLTPFDPAVLQPRATLQNARRVLRTG